MKVSEMLKLLQAEGWYLVATRGSHRQLQASTAPRAGTLNSILKQAGLKK